MARTREDDLNPRAIVKYQLWESVCEERRNYASSSDDDCASLRSVSSMAAKCLWKAREWVVLGVGPSAIGTKTEPIMKSNPVQTPEPLSNQNDTLAAWEVHRMYPNELSMHTHNTGCRAHVNRRSTIWRRASHIEFQAPSPRQRSTWWFCRESANPC